MKSYPVFYNDGATEGVPMPKSETEREQGLQVINERLESNWQQIEASKMLEGLTLLSRQNFMGTCCVAGPLEKVEA